MGEKRIAEIEAKEFRDKQREEKRNLTIQHEIERNKRYNQKVKDQKQELIDLYKDIECLDKEPKKCGFCKVELDMRENINKTNKYVNQIVVWIVFIKQKKRNLKKQKNIKNSAPVVIVILIVLLMN